MTYYNGVNFQLFAFPFSDKGDVFAWGNSEYGQLMRDDAIQQVNVPMHMKKLKGLGKILDIASGGTNCAVINGITYTFVNFHLKISLRNLKRKPR